jgi:hypothetical protein
MISFGLSRVAEPQQSFGILLSFGDYDGSCGLYQHVGNNTAEQGDVHLKDFGRRVDEFEPPKSVWGRSTGTFTPPIRPGSRLALLLSARSAKGMRTARFFVDGTEAAVVVVDDDGGDSDWVAGVMLPAQADAKVRIVPAEGEEIKKGMFRPELEKQHVLPVASEWTWLTEPTEQELKDALSGTGTDCSMLHRVTEEMIAKNGWAGKLFDFDTFSQFLLHDIDNDGFINAADFQQSIDPSMSKGEAEWMMSFALQDKDPGDGPVRLCYDDFVVMVTMDCPV